MHLRIDRALITALVVVIVDQWTKWLAFKGLSQGESVSILPGVSLGQTRNQGIAFGAFAGLPWLVYGLVALALVVLVAFYLRNRRRPGLWLATGLLLGGAIGNAIDRVALGYVRDFIELPHFPSFNVADVAITLGVIVLALTFENQQPPDHPESDDPAAAD